MNGNQLNELRRQSNALERRLLDNLYPNLATDWAQKLCAQHKIDYYYPELILLFMRLSVYAHTGWRITAGLLKIVIMK